MQDIPGFGAVRSDNPIVAEVFTVITSDMYPEGYADESNAPRTHEESVARLEQSELLNRLGGLGLIRDFADELAALNVHPIQFILEGPAILAATFITGVQVGAVLERRAASAPVIE